MFSYIKFAINCLLLEKSFLLLDKTLLFDNANKVTISYHLKI